MKTIARGLCILALGSSGCTSNPTTSTELNPCIVTAPESITSDRSTLREAEAALTILGSDILKAGVVSSTNTRVEQIYQKIPDSLVACQMLLQLGACMIKERQELGKDYLSLVDKKQACTVPSEPLASTPGTNVYIQVADASQIPLGKKIQVILGDKGFLAPGIENMKGTGVPSLNEVRYYYPNQFIDAKLVKSVLTAQGIPNVILKPLYSLPKRPSLDKAYIEVWLTTP